MVQYFHRGRGNHAAAQKDRRISAPNRGAAGVDFREFAAENLQAFD